MEAIARGGETTSKSDDGFVELAGWLLMTGLVLGVLISYVGISANARTGTLGTDGGRECFVFAVFDGGCSADDVAIDVALAAASEEQCYSVNIQTKVV